MWTKQTRITLILLSQLNRDAQSKRPLESQLQDTGRLEQEAEKIILLYRPFVGDKHNDNVCEVICAKNRRGPAFRGHVYWTGATTSFHPMTPEQEKAALCCQNRKKA
jgi:replicative DNA helicase